jgi:hypothetical protein
LLVDFTVIDFVVAPVLHKYEVPVLAVRMTESPWQKLVAPEVVMLVAGSAFTVTVVAADVAEHPLPFVTFTV